MKARFARIFELPTHQVLITKEPDTEGDGFKVVQTTDLDNVQPSLGLIFKDKAKRDECFERYDADRADKFLQSMLKMMEQFETEP